MPRLIRLGLVRAAFRALRRAVPPRAVPSAAALLALASSLGVGALPAPAAAGEGTSGPGDWRLPLAPVAPVVRGFQAPPTPYSAGHRGVDLLGDPGGLVVAAGPGAVTFAGLVGGRGVVVVEHGDLRTTYEPMQPSVEAGEHVEPGDPLGALAVSGGHCVPLACLHWGLRRGERYLDPMLLLHREPPRLLPMLGGSGPVEDSRLAARAGTGGRARMAANDDGAQGVEGSASTSTTRPASERRRTSQAPALAASGAAGISAAALASLWWRRRSLSARGP